MVAEANARQLSRAAVVLIRKHTDVSKEVVDIVTRGVVVTIDGAVVVAVGNRDGEGEGNFDGAGDGVFDTVSIETLVGLGVFDNSPQSLRHAVSLTAQLHGYGFSAANCRNSPVRSR